MDFGYYIFYVAIALAGAASMVLFFGILLHTERRFNTWLQPSIIPIIALGICISSLLSGRDLTFAALDLTLDTQGVGTRGAWILRLLTIILLGICVTRVCGRWVRDREAPIGGTGLFVAFAMFFICHSLLNSAFGTQPAFIHNLFYPIIIFSATYLARRDSLEPVILTAKYALFGIMVISLLCAVAKPTLALQPSYEGWIPGLNVRLWGVGSNANSIGPLALTALLIEYMRPCSRWWIRWPFILIVSTVLLLAQSKTVWFAGLLLLPVLTWYRLKRINNEANLHLLLGLIMLVALGIFVTLIIGPIEVWSNISTSRAGSDFASFSGRAQIWNVAVKEWLNNPLFGYGPEIWGPEHRKRIGMQFAFSAHNQFMQSLSSAGALGLGSLIIYLCCLGRYVARAAVGTKGVSIALYLLIIVRCVTETPLALNTIFNGEILIHTFLFSIALHNISLNRYKGTKLDSTFYISTIPYSLKNIR